MRQEEGGFLPHFRDEFVQIVGRRRAVPGLDALGIRHILQQTVVVVVDELALLPFAQTFHRQCELFLGLIVRRTEDIRHLRIDVDDGGDRVEDVFARLGLVIHESLWNNVALRLGAAQPKQRSDFLLCRPLNLET